jgi:serine protease
MKRRLLTAAGSLAASAGLLITLGAAGAGAKPIVLPTLTKEVQQQKAIWAQHTLAPLGPITPPAPPCPENGLLPSPFSACGIPEAPATTLPYPGNMAYWGGHVQVHPKVYIVYWGWGEKNAFPKTAKCRPETLLYGTSGTTLACDPDGAGRRAADWVSQMGQTGWSDTQQQYFQDVIINGQVVKQYVKFPKNMLGGLWADDTDPIAYLAKTNGSNPPGSKNTYTDLAREAARAVAHFGITDLANADIVVAQPPNFSDPNALSSGYCAFHDYTQPTLEGGIYNGIKPGISYTNLPYQLAINSGGANVCGENAVNSGAAGKLDGTSIVLGHEIMETVTDPGAEDIIGNVTTGGETNLGGWYDTVDANENGDKCAWVGEPLVGGVPGAPNVLPVPGAMGDIKGNRGTTFPVQSLWSNDSAGGAGYCAGAGTDLPVTG